MNEEFEACERLDPGRFGKFWETWESAEPGLGRLKHLRSADMEDMGRSWEKFLEGEVDGDILLMLDIGRGCSNRDFFSLNSSHLIIPRGSSDRSTNFSNSSNCLNFDSDTAFFPFKYFPMAGSEGWKTYFLSFFSGREDLSILQYFCNSSLTSSF